MSGVIRYGRQKRFGSMRFSRGFNPESSTSPPWPEPIRKDGRAVSYPR